MEIKKVNLDRKPIETEYIRSRQDFQQILKAYKKAVNPVWKQPLFYGVVGFASLAAAVTFSLIDLNSGNEGKTTLEQLASSEMRTMEASLSVNDTGNLTAELLPAVSNVAGTQPKRKHAVEKQEDLTSSQMEGQVSDYPANDPLELSSVSRPARPAMPTLGGASEGTMAVKSLCSKEGIETTDGSKVRSFTIQYYAGFNDNLLHVKGNTVPIEVCVAIEKSGGDQLVYITEILAEKLDGDVKLPSLSFWVEV